jgi:acetylornithine/succinyldiaminopimelate/putrescine aminotransferase
MEVLEKEQLAARAAKAGAMVMEKIRGFKNAGTRVKEVRGKGLMIGVELTAADGGPVVKKALALGLVINATQKNVLRLAPALTISEDALKRGLAILEQALDAV